MSSGKDQIKDVPWEVVPLRKYNHQGGGESTFRKPWTKQNTASRRNVWSGNGNFRPQSSTSRTSPVAPPPPQLAIAAPSQYIWNQKGRGGAVSQGESGHNQFHQHMNPPSDEDGEESRVKYEMKSYCHEMVVSGVKQMSEDNQQLMSNNEHLEKRAKAAEENAKAAEENAKAAEETAKVISAKLRRNSEELRIYRQLTNEHLEYKNQEMIYQETYYKNQIKSILAARDAKEDSFEKLQHKECETMMGSNAGRDEGVVDFIRYHDKEIKEFGSEGEELMKIYEEKRAAVQQRYHDEVVELENQFNAELNQLRSKFTLHNLHQSKDGSERL